jgi:hypothetical protein
MGRLQTAKAAKRWEMTLTRSFKETVIARIGRDTAFRDALLREGVECLLSGDVDTGKAVLRDYINATIGFEHLSEVTNTPPKSLCVCLARKVIRKLEIYLLLSLIFKPKVVFTLKSEL